MVVVIIIVGWTLFGRIEWLSICFWFIILLILCIIVDGNLGFLVIHFTDVLKFVLFGSVLVLILHLLTVYTPVWILITTDLIRLTWMIVLRRELMSPFNRFYTKLFILKMLTNWKVDLFFLLFLLFTLQLLILYVFSRLEISQSFIPLLYSPFSSCFYPVLIVQWSSPSFQCCLRVYAGFILNLHGFRVKKVLLSLK